MKGYKAFNNDLTCRDINYEVGQTYTFDGEPIYCLQGFHFCKNIADVYKYYDMSDDTRICEVVALGDVVTDNNIKYCTNKIKIVREIKSKAIKHCNVDKSDVGYCNTGDMNTGCYNTGSYNSGDKNTGSDNSGNSNTGECNSGNSNTGNCNSGNSNTGFSNSGYYNSGNMNIGDRNTGECNSGNSNTGNCNSGNRNSGDINTGSYNSGDKNTGFSNSGDRNTGERNTGYYNSGDWNCGDWNCGDRNCGDWNCGDWNCGVFNTSNKHTIKMFDKESNWTIDDWFKSNARRILSGCPYTYSDFVHESQMTEEEKRKYPEYNIIGGFVKVYYVTKKDRQKWWDSLSEEDKQECYKLPNFDAYKFVKCLGIDHI